MSAEICACPVCGQTVQSVRSRPPESVLLAGLHFADGRTMCRGMWRDLLAAPAPVPSPEEQGDGDGEA